MFEKQLGLTVSVAKSVVVASKPSVAAKIVKRSKAKKLSPTRHAKLLGTGAGGGRRRTTAVVRTRLRAFKSSMARMWKLKKAGANTKLMTRAAGTATVGYGIEVQGASDAMLKNQRSVISRAAAPQSGGRNPTRNLCAIDGSTGTMDPLFDAHVLPVKHWALAWWESWADTSTLEAAHNNAKQKLRDSSIG